MMSSRCMAMLHTQSCKPQPGAPGQLFFCGDVRFVGRPVFGWPSAFAMHLTFPRTTSGAEVLYQGKQTEEESESSAEVQFQIAELKCRVPGRQKNAGLKVVTLIATLNPVSQVLW